MKSSTFELELSTLIQLIPKSQPIQHIPKSQPIQHIPKSVYYA